VRRLGWLAAVTLLPLLSTLAAAQGAETTLEALRRDGHLQLEASLAPETGIVPGQKLTLTLEIATDRWFAGGTRISLPEVPGLVILQTEQFASNASERRGNTSWVLQRWTLDVYPQRAGRFSIPPITTRLKINAGEAGDVEGILRSPPLAFTATLPASLADIGQWVAAPEFTVSQSFDKSLENLQVGDAFEREILLEAGDIMAMMLPAVEARQQPGLAAYPSPPVLDNSSNRGQLRASRRQHISYVVQAEGRYQLPALDFFWWDTARGELRVVSLPATEFTVGSGAAGAMDPGAGKLPVTPRQLLAACASLVLLLALLWLARKFLPAIPPGRLTAAVTRMARKVSDLRKPALPARLNPGSSAGE